MQITEHAIVVKNLSKKFGNFQAVHNASFNVNHGSLHGFIGPNGAGKTTTIKCLITAIIPQKGKMLINNHDVNSMEAKKIVGYIPEKAIFPKGISTYSFLLSMAELSGIKKQQAKPIIDAQLKKYDLWNKRNKSPLTFSSGMKKKVLLIQSLINNPEILILDEPAANLDPTARTELFNELKKLSKEGKTIFISSHILAELQNFVDEITILNQGKVAYSGKLNQDTYKYEIKSNDDKMLYQLLKDNNFQVKYELENINVVAKNDEQINKIQSLALKNKITIYSLQSQSTDLQKLYEEMVMAAPKENQ